MNADIEAAKHDWFKTASLGEEKLNGFRLYRAFGPSSTGKTVYGRALFRLDIMDTELVPQLTLVRLPEQWAQRMAKISRWHQTVGDRAACSARVNELLNYIANFAQMYPDLKLDCT